MSGATAFLAAVGLSLAAMAASAQDLRTERVAFPAGASGTVIEDSIQGYETVSYLVGAEAGQTMRLALESDNAATYFNLYAPGTGPGDAALAIGEMQPEINRFEGVLPASGTYTVSVFLYRSAARRDERSDFTLEIAIPPVDLSRPVEGDFADGLQGGPDFWEVRSAGMLNLRREPSTGAAVAGRAEPGQVLRNLGCRMNEGRTWCRVATLADPGIEGWAAGEFLGESSYVAGDAGAGVATQLPNMVPVEGFDATGDVPCAAGPGAAAQRCPFGVVRQGGGSGLVSVTLPDGSLRVIVFEGGEATGFDRAESDGAMAFRVERREDNSIVTLGAQTVTLPDAVIWGG